MTHSAVDVVRSRADAQASGRRLGGQLAREWCRRGPRVPRLAWPVSGGGARRREAPERGGPCREPAWASRLARRSRALDLLEPCPAKPWDKSRSTSHVAREAWHK